MNAPEHFSGLQRPLSRFWLTPEVTLLSKHYPIDGPHFCTTLLPGRTISSVQAKANVLGLKAPSTLEPFKKRWGHSPELDTAIITFYAKLQRKGDIQKFAQRIDRPDYWIKKRAQTLGCAISRIKELPWCAPELALLHEQAHKTPAVISKLLRKKGFCRSITAIAVKLKRLQCDTADPNHYTANALSILMGVNAKTITRWIEVEGLPARRRGTERKAVQGGDMWWISRKSLKTWIAGHAQLIDLRRVDRFWFIDLLAGTDL